MPEEITMTGISKDIWDNSDIIDNTHITLKKAFSERALNADREICIASGYLYLTGLLEVIDSFHENAEIRILMGNETDKITAEVLEHSHKAACMSVVENDLVHAAANNLQLLKFYNMIIDGKAAVRIYTKTRFHAKAYIFARHVSDDDKAIIGSSNLTASGLSSNTELNVVHKSSSDMHLVKSWFDTKWEEAEPFERSLLKIIDESGKLPDVTKDFVGIRGLILETASEILRTYGPLTPSIRQNIEPLAPFQADGAAMIESAIDRFGGAILSDSVGLGKTFVGMRVLENYLGKNPTGCVLVIAPRSAMMNWKSIMRNKKFNVRQECVELRSTTQISNFDPEADQSDQDEIEHLAKCELIVIDEAHRFRNLGRKNRKNLEKIGTRGKQVMLITATAVNNSVKDLANLIYLFTDGTSLINHDNRLGLDVFKEYARARKDGMLESKQLDKLQSQIDLILRAVMVQRTRTHIQGQIIEGKPLTFLTPQIRTYDCDSLCDDFYAELKYMLSTIKLPHMHIVSEKKNNLSVLYKILLYKRLESGLVALDRSLERLRKSQSRLLEAINSDNPKEKIEKWWKDSRSGGVDEGNLDDYDEEIGGVLGRIRNMSNDEINQLKNDLEYDIATVSRFIERNIKPRRMGDGLYLDPKINAFNKILGLLAGKKILVFTESVDTAEWLGIVLKSKKHKSYAVVTGQTDDVIRNDIIRRFSPHSNPEKESIVDARDEISILIATDTLSEAVNLQDCSNVVNFDLPWNPMVIVQRVGRIDRIGNLGHTHVHNIMPSGSLEHLLNLVDTLQSKIGSVIDTVGKEFRILSEDEEIEPKRFEQDIRKHPAYTGDVAEAASTIVTRGRAINDMTVPARERLEQYNMEPLFAVPANPPCAAIQVSGTPHILIAMYRIFDKIRDAPLTDVVVTAMVDNEGAPNQLEEIDEDAKRWLDLFDFTEHDYKTKVAPPSTKSRKAVNQLEELFKNDIFETHKNRYSHPGRKPSSAEKTFLSRLGFGSKVDSHIVDILESAPFDQILFKVAGTEHMDPTSKWIKKQTDDEILRDAKYIAEQLEKSPGFVQKRNTGDIGFRLICWCAREPN